MVQPTETIAQFLTNLQDLNIKLQVAGDRLSYDAPPDAATPTLLQTLRTRKAEILSFLQQAQANSTVEDKLNFWRLRLSDAPTLLQLPTNRTRPSEPSCRGARLSFGLSPSLYDGLKALSREACLPVSTVLLTAFATLLFRYSEQADMLLGLNTTNPSRATETPSRSFMANTLTLRVNLSNNPTFRELLTHIQQVVVEAQQHQDVSYKQLLEALKLERTTNYHPLVQTMFSWQEAEVGTAQVAQQNVVTPLDLTLEIVECESALVGHWIYNPALFDEAAVQRMTGHLQTLLAGIVTHPSEQIERLPLLTEAERHLMLVEWNQTDVDHPLHRCVHELFEAQAQQTPNAFAVIYEDTQYTYHDLNQRANQLAHYLITLGLGPEDLVGVLVERSLDVVVAMLAIFKAGAAYLPLDPTYPADRLAFMFEDAQLSLLLTQQKWLANLPPHQATVICLDADGDANVIATHAISNPGRHVPSDHLAYVIYTSGSTGKPKGVQVEHRSLTNMTQNDIAYLDMGPNDRLTQFFSLSFDASIAEILCPICAGSSLYILTDEQVLSGSALFERLKTQAITHLFLTPSLLATLPAAAENDFPALKAVFSAGEACTPDLVKQWSKGRHFYNIYGPTEFTIAATICECTPDGSTPPIGRPYDNCQAYVLDQHVQPVPIGVTGELYLGGVQLARGYLNRPELTAEKFIANPFGPQDNPGQLYRTGDLVSYRPDGNLVFVGRVDGMVKVRGLRTELGEIEAVLNAHPDVQQAVISAYKDASGRDQHLVAHVVPAAAGNLHEDRLSHEAESLTSASLSHFAAEKLPAFMVPSAFVFLTMLPLTPSGKVDRHALPTPRMDNIEEAGRTDLTPPRTATEEMIAAIWRQLLQLEQVGIHENFFELGGHSLLATQVASRLKQSFHVELPIRELFDFVTIAELADILDTKTIEQSDDDLLAHLLAEVDDL